MRDSKNRGITGGRGAAPIWADFMTRATDGEPPRAFSIPTGIKMKKINPVSGAAAGLWTKQSMPVAVRTGQDIGQSPQFSSETPDSAIKTKRQSSIVEEDLSPER
jgi:membrane carboxypeptidase/penicillin-binding protein